MRVSTRSSIWGFALGSNVRDMSLWSWQMSWQLHLSSAALTPRLNTAHFGGNLISSSRCVLVCVCVCMCRFAPSTCGCLGIIVLVSYMSVCSNSAALPEENEVETRRTMFDECAQTKTSGRQVVVHSPEECLNLTNIPWPLRRIIAPNFCFLCNKQNESDSSVLLHTRHQRRDVSTSKDCNGGSHHLSAVGKESRPVLARCKSVMSVRECDSQYRHSPSLSWPGFTGNTNPPVYTRKSTETPRLSFFPLSF